GSEVMLGGHVFIIAATMAAGAIWLAVRRRSASIPQLVAPGVMIAFTYVLLTLGHDKASSFGLPLYTLLLLLSLAVLRVLLLAEQLQRPAIRWASGLLVVFLVAGIASWKWPEKWGDVGGYEVEQRNRIAREVFDALQARPGRQGQVLVT